MNTATVRILVAVLLLALLAGFFWFLAVAPKRERASELDAQVEKLRRSVAEKTAAADAAAEARKGFDEDYEQFVLLGKAVPADDETASLLVELGHVAKTSGVEFRDLELDDTATAGAPPPAPAPTVPAAAQPSATEPTPEPGAPGAEQPAQAVAASSVVPATEASAAILPLGATIGSAGLGVMPYKLMFRGSFFDAGEFIEGVNSLVKTKEDSVGVNGRLITIDGFALGADPRKGFPYLVANLAVTTYVTPPPQPAAAVGTTPTTPPAPTDSGATPVSSTPPAP